MLLFRIMHLSCNLFDSKKPVGMVFVNCWDLYSARFLYFCQGQLVEDWMAVVWHDFLWNYLNGWCSLLFMICWIYWSVWGPKVRTPADKVLKVNTSLFSQIWLAHMSQLSYSNSPFFILVIIVWGSFYQDATHQCLSFRMCLLSFGVEAVVDAHVLFNWEHGRI